MYALYALYQYPPFAADAFTLEYVETLPPSEKFIAVGDEELVERFDSVVLLRMYTAVGVAGADV